MSNEQADDFVCMDISSIDDINGTHDTPNPALGLGLIENGKIFDIKKDGKRLWIKCPDVVIKYPYSTNSYKPSQKDGTIVLHASDALTTMVDVIDGVVKQEFNRLYDRKILDNIMMTKGAIDDMFRSSLYNDTLRVYVSEKNCAVFSKEGILDREADFSTTLKSDLSLGVVLEPAFAWMFRGKIGIHWDARQIKLKQQKLKLFNNGQEVQQSSRFRTPAKGTFKNIFVDSDEEDNKRGHSKILPLKIPEVTVPMKGSFKNILSDSDDDDDLTKPRKILEPSKVQKLELTTSFRNILLDSDEDE